MPKLDEDDFVEPGNLPQIAQSKSPIPAGLGGGVTQNATTPTSGLQHMAHRQQVASGPVRLVHQHQHQVLLAQRQLTTLADKLQVRCIRVANQQLP